MANIKLNNFPIEIVECFDPDGNSLGLATEIQFQDFRRQIAEQKAEGYYFIYNDIKYPINKYGCAVDKWPKGLFMDQIIITAQLLKAQTISRKS